MMAKSSLDAAHMRCLNDLIAAAVHGNSFRIHTLMGSWDDEKRKLISNSVDSEETYTPLMWAAREGSAAAVEALCSYECVIKDKKGGWNESTALMRAIERGHVEVVSTLIKCKVDLNTQNKYGMTALMLTSEVSNNEKIFTNILQIIDLLILNQANMNLKNKDGNTALILAAEVGNTEVMTKYLTVMDIEIDAANQFGKTALILAAEFGHLNALKALFDRVQPANVSLLSRRGLSALMLGAVNGHLETVKYLVKKNADVFHINKRRENEGKFVYFDTALSMACNKAQLMMVKELILIAPQLCNAEYQPYNALRNACMKNDPVKRSDILEIVQLLISKGVVTEECMKICDDDGNTCIMHACQTGNIEVVCELLDAVTAPTEQNVPAEANNSEVLIEFLLWGLTNKEGSNAVSLLATFYKDFEDSKDKEQGKPKDGLGSFLQLAVTNNIKHPYLLDMFKEMLPLLKSPLSFMNEFKSDIINNLESNCGNPASDVQLMNSLVNIAAAIKRAQICHPEEQKDLKKMFDEFEDMLMECMQSPKLDDPEIVVLLFSLDRISGEKPDGTNLRVQRANALLKGPLKVCIEHEIYKVLASPQIIAHVHKVFEDSLKFNSPDHIRDFNDLFQLRSGCPTYRFNPFVMFSFESLMKLFLLVIVSVTSFTSGETSRCNTTSQLVYMQHVCNYRNIFEYAIVVFWFTSLLYEIGEILNRMRESKANDFINILADLRSASRRHFSDKWNIIDVITIVLQAGWVFFRYVLISPIAETLLATSTITLALVILRFQSLWPETGKLVTMVFEMIKDLGSLLSVFLIVILGFGITFHSLIPDAGGDSFKSLTSTFLTLFDASLGQHDFTTFTNTRHSTIGVCLMVLFITLAMIVILNLVIARMSSTIEKIETISTELWARIQAANAQEYVLIYERHPFCMLPAPFNLISIVVDIIETYNRRKIAREPSNHSVVSYAGSFSDKITSICFAPISAVRELHLMLDAVWTLSIPRENQLIITFFAACLALVWIILFTLLIVLSTFRQENTKMNLSNRRIEFASSEDDEDDNPRGQDNITLMFAVSCLISKNIIAYIFGKNFGPSIWFGFFGAIVVLLMEPTLPKKYAMEDFVKKSLSITLIPTAPTQQTDNHVVKYVDYVSIVAFIALAIVAGLLRIDAILLAILSTYFIYSLYFKIEQIQPTKSKSSRYLSQSNKSIVRNVGAEAVEVLQMNEVSTETPLEDQNFVRDDSPGKQAEASTMRPKIRRISGRRSTRSSILYQAVDQIMNSETPETSASSVQGKLKINILRGDLKKTGLTYFGRKVNPYVRILYGSDSAGWQGAVSRVVNKGGKCPEWFDDNIRISLRKDLYMLKIQVWDHHDASARSENAWDTLLLEKEVDIKEWIANKRYDGLITMTDATNKWDETDGIQLSVRVVYDAGKVALHNTGSNHDISGNLGQHTQSSASSRKAMLTSSYAFLVNNIRQNRSRKSTIESSDTDVHVDNTKSREDSPNIIDVAALNDKFLLNHPSSLSRQNSELFLFSPEDRDRIFKRKKKRGSVSGSGTVTATVSPR